MQEQEIIRYLQLLGEELAFDVEIPIRLLLVGGAFMVTQIGNRTATMDVDVVSYIDPYSVEYRAFKNAANFVAGRMHIDLAWLSDNIGDFISDVHNIPFHQLWLKHGMLEVYIPAPEYMFVLKVISGREKDIPDVQALAQHLHIKKRKQAEKLLKKYGVESLLSDYAEEIEETLAALFG